MPSPRRSCVRWREQPALVHGVIPALDRLVGDDTTNPPEAAINRLENDKYYEWIVRAFIPAQYAATFLGAWVAGQRRHPCI